MKRALKRLRGSQPFNYLTTTAVKGALNVAGIRSETVIKHLHRMGTVSCRLPNGRTLRLWSRADDWVSNQVYWRGWHGYEPETAPVFFRLATKARVTLDVGAYVGFFACLAAHANPKGKVFAFEPLPAIYERLNLNVRLNRLDNINTTQTAVAETNGDARFFHVGDGLPTSSSLSYPFMQGTEGLTSSDVPVVSLDSFLAQKRVEGVDLIKIDTESTEPDVLRGALTTLQRDHPTIICEVLVGRGTAGALEELLAPLGYQFYLLTPKGAERRERIEGHPQWLNYLLVTGEKTEQIECVGKI